MTNSVFVFQDEPNSVVVGSPGFVGPISQFNGFEGLAYALEAEGRSVAIQILGDSTGNGTGSSDADWPAYWGNDLASMYPNWTVYHKVWNDTTQDYDAPLLVHTAPGGERYLDCDSGTAGLRLDAQAYAHVSGVLDVRVKVRAADWTPAAGSGFSCLIAKGSASPAISWRFGVANSGLLNFFFSTNGTSTTGVGSTVTTGVTDGGTKWLRVLFNPNDGAGNRVTKFYTGDDGVAWTQLGATVTTVGTVVVFDETTTGYQLGALDTATSPGFDLYEVQVRNGDGGPQVVPAKPDCWGAYGGATTPPNLVGKPTLTIVNGSHPGAGISYLGDATRLPKMTPDYGQIITLLSTSHNETRKMGSQWITALNGWLTTLRARQPQGSIVPLTQNPETSGTPYYLAHAQRRLDLMAWCRSYGLNYVDTYAAFLGNPDWDTELLADAVHPNLAGSQLWADTIMTELDRAKP